jgi:ankyrin repeat protein
VFGAACLLHNGADVNCLAKDKSTPLHLAAASGNDDMIKLLLAYGASTNIRNRDGFVPHDVNCSNVSLR